MKTNECLLYEMKTKKRFEIKKYMSRKDIQDKSTLLRLKTFTRSKKIIPGWLDKPKGLLKVLWERGFIDELMLTSYSEKGKKIQLDRHSHEILPEYRKYVLQDLMSTTTDFKDEPTAMQQLMSTSSDRTPTSAI